MENPSVRKAARMNDIELLLLAHPQGLAPGDIAERLGVDKSTVSRYLHDLPKHIYVDDLDGGKWKVDKQAYLINVRFNLHEALAIHLAARLLTTRIDRQNPHAASALRKLGNALEGLAPHISRHMLQSAEVMETGQRKDLDYLHVLEGLSLAWAEGRKLRVWHRAEADGKLIAYIFSPYFIEPYAVGQSTHVIGFREPPGKVRTFKVERIERVEPLGEHYEIPADFDPSSLLADAWGIWYTEAEPVEVVLKFGRGAAGRVKESRWHRSEEVEEQEDGSLIWRAKIAEPRELLHWIRGWGAEVEVLKPAMLRETLRLEQRKAAENYGWTIIETTIPSTIPDETRLEIKEKATYYAHSLGDDKANWQTILQHLTATTALARTLGEDTGFAEFAAAAAMLHDLGKYSPEFQRRLEGLPGIVDHSTAGAKEIDRLLAGREQPLIGRLLAYCIAGHHGGLPNGGSPTDIQDDSTLAGRLKRILKDYSAFGTELEVSTLNVPSRFPAYFRPIPDAHGFSVAFATRMIYSILVDADYLDTETFFHGGKTERGEYADIQTLAERFEQHLRRFDHPQREIDQRRSATLKACMAQANQPPGLFTLTLPTGAGKTLTSMAFAMRHAIRNGLKRIIYVIPYTSIIEQNAAVFKSSMEGFEDHILEHHSTFDWNAQQEESEAGQPNSVVTRLKWASENWNIPIVVTTNVQFFESLFSNRSSRSRKVHNLAKSIIIFDEAQTLPREFMKPCMYSVVELVRNYGASAVFCTATQPALERFLPKGVELNELIPEPQAEFDYYHRVKVKQAGRLTDTELLERLRQQIQVLCIVNTRKHAKALFEGIQGEGCFHLSTLMCAAHRREVIAEIRLRLAEGLPCRVISTQLLEAGVDLDFPVGYRALAGLESIIQSAGRVNREGKLTESELFVFEPDSEYARRMPNYIKQTAETARVILGRFADGDPVCVDAIRAYYSLLYGLSDPKAFDSRGILDCFEKGGSLPTFDFATAAEKFKIIDEDTMPVIVPYDENARSLIHELQIKNVHLTTIRKLQPYTVNVYQSEYAALENSGAIDLFADTYAVLNRRGSYDQQTGLILANPQGGYGIFTDF